MTDVDLLRAYEPILRFTDGELFFPVAVEPYVRACDLWMWVPERGLKLLVPHGALDLGELVRVADAHPDRALFLRFVQWPLTGLEYRRWRQARPPFRAPGRLARVGLVPRLLDAAFSLSLLVRASVPGGTTAAADVKYRQIMADDPRYTYYGRVVREGGYVVLQYLFFYAMNDWRSSFHGANDHEADWELVTVYLEDRGDDPPVPVWVAVASHGESGDDLRRRWDDPDLARVGDYPVVYVAAGSHAGHFLPGEYLTAVEARPLRPLVWAVRTAQRVWRRTRREGRHDEVVDRLEPFVSVAFVDYARGNGFAIGPGQPAAWSPVVISDADAWVDRYRGLWGLETQDPLGSEKPPAGPKYYPDGTVRHSWHDPLGWAGLDKVAPPGAAAEVLAGHVAELERDLAAVEQAVADLRRRLPGLELEVRALRRVHHLARLRRERQAVLAEQAAELRALQERRVGLAEAIGASRRHLAELAAGRTDDPRAHLRRVHRPQTGDELRQNRLAEAWAALSVGLILAGVAAFVALGAGGWLLALALLFGTSVVVEATLRGRLHKLLLNVTIGLALIATGVLAYEFAWQLLLLGVSALAALIIADNLRELRGR